MSGVSSLDLTDTRNLIPLLQRHGFTTRKGLGQHFLISPNSLRAILDGCALHEGLPVFEIGPGIGTVTRALAEAGAEVHAVELDQRAIAVLHETVGAFASVHVIPGDILKVDLAALLGTRRWTVVGNLPYYITTPVLSRILECSAQVARAVLLVQREVAERMTAPPGSRVYGSLSVYAQVFAKVERLARVSKGAFLPPPSVESAVIRLTMYAEPLVPTAQQPLFFTLVRAAFGQRRKMIENALAGAGMLQGDRAQLHAALTSADIAPESRAETLSVDAYLRLTEEVARRI